MFLRIFCPPRTKKNRVFYASWGVIWFNLLYCIALVLTVLLQCVGKSVKPRHGCIDRYAVLVIASIINVVTDLAMLAIPLSAVWDLQMPRKRKLGLSIVFLVGAL